MWWSLLRERCLIFFARWTGQVHPPRAAERARGLGRRPAEERPGAGLGQEQVSRQRSLARGGRGVVVRPGVEPDAARGGGAQVSVEGQIGRAHV